MNGFRRRCVIVVADDDEGDRYLIQKAMEDSGVESELHFVEDGQQLVDRLTSQLQSPEQTMPCLVLLDLNMPGSDGREALKTVKSHPDLKGIPVVILTSSSNPDDVLSTYRDGANSFFTKPLSYGGLVELVELLKTYGLQTARLPFESA